MYFIKNNRGNYNEPPIDATSVNNFSHVVSTLKEWQQHIKPVNSLLFNCSEYSHLNDEWVNFPIGVCVHLINYKGNYEPTQMGSHDRTVLSAISNTTDMRRRPTGINRRSIIENLKKNNIPNHNLDFSNYIENLSKYKFIISPEGNGIDCHRHYEALIAGCIPIIEDNPLIRKKYNGCPILYTKDYSEITEEYLNSVYDTFMNTKYDFSCLFLNNYNASVRQEIIRNGNYWAKRIYNRIWYKTIKVCDVPKGRLGNAIFRYLASSLFCVSNNAERVDVTQLKNTMSDSMFIEYYSNNSIPIHTEYMFDGYFQHDTVYRNNKKELMDYISSHPNDILRTDSGATCRAGELLVSPTIKVYELVIHIRLEDFITINVALHPDAIKSLLDKIYIQNSCIVLNNTTTDLERAYVNYVKGDYDISIESNDVLTDFHIMKNAKVLVCSESTLSWCAAFFSNTVETVYMPNYNIGRRSHETFRKPIDNTIFYEIKTVSSDELKVFLSNK